MKVELQNTTAKAILRNIDNVSAILAPLDSLVARTSYTDSEELTVSSSNEMNLIKKLFEDGIAGEAVDLDFIQVEPTSRESFSITVDEQVLEKVIDATGNYLQQCVGPMFQIAISAKAFALAVPKITTGFKK